MTPDMGHAREQTVIVNEQHIEMTSIAKESQDNFMSLKMATKHPPEDDKAA